MYCIVYVFNIITYKIKNDKIIIVWIISIIARSYATTYKCNIMNYLSIIIVYKGHCPLTSVFINLTTTLKINENVEFVKICYTLVESTINDVK